MDLDLQNKVVIVTGCNGGIGEAICQSFLKEGSLVVGFYRGPLSKVDALSEWVKTNNIPTDHFLAVNVEITSTESIQQGLSQVMTKWKKVDVLVNNAGWTVEKPFLSLEDDELDQIYSTNFSSLAKLSREVSKIMMRQKSGNIINISSAVSEDHGRGVAVYASMKAAVNRFTEILALEMGRKKIRVNCICPGVVETKMSNGLQERHNDLLLEKTPLGRFARPDEIATSVLFLASEKTAAFITGTNIFVDGGIGL